VSTQITCKLRKAKIGAEKQLVRHCQSGQSATKFEWETGWIRINRWIIPTDCDWFMAWSSNPSICVMRKASWFSHPRRSKCLLDDLSWMNIFAFKIIFVARYNLLSKICFRFSAMIHYDVTLIIELIIFYNISITSIIIYLFRFIIIFTEL